MYGHIESAKKPQSLTKEPLFSNFCEGINHHYNHAFSLSPTLANLLLRINGLGRQFDEVTSEISGKYGIEERLEKRH